MYGGIINSLTKLHLVGYCYWLCTEIIYFLCLLYGCGLFMPSAFWLWLVPSLCSANQSYQLNSWHNLRMLHSDGKRMYPVPCNEILHLYCQWRLVICHVWPLDGHFRSVFVLTWCCLSSRHPLETATAFVAVSSSETCCGSAEWCGNVFCLC